MFLPTNPGLADDLTMLLVVAFLTTWVRTGERLGLCVTEPRYSVVIESFPAPAPSPRSVVLPFTSVALPTEDNPLKSTTVPVGVPEPELTAAVNVTCP